MPQWPDSWEWHKVEAGHYRVEGYEIKQTEHQRWETTEIGKPYPPVDAAMTLQIAIDSLDAILHYSQ